jgi:hypothetical protein
MPLPHLGAYDAECEALLKLLHAEGVVLVVIGGEHGTGFSVMASPTHIRIAAHAMRDAADAMDRAASATSMGTEKPSQRR